MTGKLGKVWTSKCVSILGFKNKDFENKPSKFTSNVLGTAKKAQSSNSYDAFSLLVSEGTKLLHCFFQETKLLKKPHEELTFLISH